MSAATILAVNILDPHSLLSSFGPAGVGMVLFAETGLLIGFFLPGDSLLCTSGVLAAAPATASLHLPLGRALLCAAVRPCLGAQTGYWIGRRVGPPLFDRSTRARPRDGRDRAEHYLARYGHGKAIMLARFVPVVRTVLNPLAGIVGVPQRTFAFWQVAGALVWSVGVVLAGYALGSHIKNVDHYLQPLIAVIIIVSLIPIGVELMRARRASRGTA